MNRIKKITLILLVVALAVASALSLCACNEQADDDGDVVRNLYIYTIKFSGEEENSNAPSDGTSAFDEQTDRVATVYVGFSKPIGKSKAQARYGIATGERTVSSIS